MGARPGDSTDDLSFSLPNHQKEGLTDKQCADKIADFFASISQEYTPFDIDLLPERVKVKLQTQSAPTVISEHECYMKIKVTKKPSSGVHGDLPSSFLKEFAVELTKPITSIFNNIVKSAFGNT